RARRRFFESDLEGEPAAKARRALKSQFAPHHPHELGRDRQPEPSAAEAARRRAIGLSKRLEDRLLLFLGNADAGVFDRERDRRTVVCLGAAFLMTIAFGADSTANRNRSSERRCSLSAK